MLTNFFSTMFGKYKMWRYKRHITSLLGEGRGLFSDFGDNVYMSDFVNNCIDRIATKISKVEVISVIEKEGRIKKLNDDITRLFRFRPNELQTTKDFLACCEWLRRKDCNCFIYPQYTLVEDGRGGTYKRYTAFYPLNPTGIEIGINENNGNAWEIKFFWKDGSCDYIPYNELIHLRWRRGKNTIVGGGSDGGDPDTRDLLNSVKTLDKVMQGLPKSIEASLKIRAIYTVKSLIGKDQLKKQSGDFEEHIKESKSGIIATDLGGDLKPFTVTPANIPQESLNFLKGIIRERYGISEAILSGDYSGDQDSAFYESCVEDFMTEFEQAASSILFTEREQDIGHRVKCYYDKVMYLSTGNKIELANLATNTGLMTLNEIGAMFGMPPFEDGNRRLQSLNYVNSNIIDKYQLRKAGKEDGDKKEN